eukprot:s1538_g13.t1
MTNLTHELDFIDLELGISEPVAIQDSDEVDNASDGSVSESADSEQSPISTEDCYGTSDEEEDEEETEERIHNSCRDQLLLQSSTRALRVDALEARDVHEEAARQELDPDSAASLVDPQLVVFGAVKVIGGLMLKSMCDGRGWEVACHSGQAAWSCALAYIQDQGASFILLIPLATARQWWKQRQGVEGVCRFRRHQRHGCRVAMETEASLRAQLQDDSDIFAAVVEATHGTTDPFIRWL